LSPLRPRHYNTNRQTGKGLAKKNGTPRKEERYLDNKIKKLTIYGKEEVGVDDEHKGSMDWKNNVRYLRMN
jgi:hypothetical protein